jgi:lysophospholipase L1-like esterase
MQTPLTGRRLPSVHIKLALASLFVSLLVLAGLAELIVRIRAQIRYGSGFFGIEQLYRESAALGIRELVPSTTAGNIHINSLGFRGPEIATPKASSTTRIAFLGGSTTLCAEVSDDADAWPAVTVERLRRQLTKRDFDYINGGVPGYTTRDSRRAFEARIVRHTPDIAVIYHATNDLARNSVSAAARQHVDTAHLHDRGMTWVGQYSLLWYLVEKNLRIRSTQQTAARKTSEFVADIPLLARQFEADLRALVAGVQAAGPRVVLVTIATRLRRDQSPAEQSIAAASALYYVPFMTPADLVESYAAYNDVIRRVASDLGLLLIEAELAIPADALHFADTVHFTDRGSHRLGELVADALMAGPALRP